ncbi:MAG: exosome complex exonuclease Rrp41 [Candidatus Aenigmatarchaeota archaeon]
MRQRANNELRKIEVKVNVIPNADGSAYFAFGNTKALAAVYGPKELLPKFLQDDKKATVRVRYNMAPFSTDTRKSPGPDRRSIEISKVLKDAIENAIFVEDYPRAAIDCYAEIISSDGSTRVTALNAISISLALAGVAMKDLIAACTAGKYNGNLIIDLDQEEDNNGEADLAFAILPNKEDVVLLQMDGLLSKEELLKLFEMLRDATKKIYEEQVKAIKNYYENI